MRKRKLRIYLDTSVISYYTARPHADPLVRSRQSATRRWWEAYGGSHRFFISAYVLKEISKGDPAAAGKRQAVVRNFDVLDPKPAVIRLGFRLFKELGIPYRSELDAYHLAIAALNRLDYLVSWNFKHMANDGVRAAYAAICAGEGLKAPLISTPEEMPAEGGGT